MAKEQKTKEQKSKIAPLSSEYDTTISLLNVYLTEWIHRDELLWKQVFKYFYATLVVILLPNIAGFLSIELPPLPVKAFRIVGIVIAVFFLYTSIGYAMRLQASGDTCKKLIDSLPGEYRRMSISKLPLGAVFQPRMSYLTCIVMFLCLIALAVLFFVL